MATTTPRIGLTKPDGTDLVDIAVLNTNFDKIDSNIASTKIQATKPATANAGDLWWDSDTGTLYVYYTDANSSQWVAATSDPINIGVVASQAERDAQYPTPQQGMSVYRTDLGTQEIYYGLYNASTNPGGATTAGWYPNVPIMFNKSVGSTNPIPNTYSDVGNSSQVLVIPKSNMICEIEVTARVQMNIAMNVEIWVAMDGTDIATTKVQSNSTGEIHIPLFFRTTTILSAGNHSPSLRIRASASNAAVFYDARWKVTLTPPTKPLGA